METFLQMENFETSSVTIVDDNGLIPILEKERPDLIVLDVNLLSRDTLGDVRALRAADSWQRVPVLMTSAIDSRRQCLDAGANDFMLKPFNWQDVTHRIKEILGNSIYQEA
jgi:DNA-binding response OmpR family regulator